MSITPSTGAPIDLQTAANWCQNYRNQNPGQVKATGFGINILNDILGQQGVVGIRMYHAINDSGERTLILVGVDGAGNDMVNGVIADFGSQCPISCPPTSNPLNP